MNDKFYEDKDGFEIFKTTKRLEYTAKQVEELVEEVSKDPDSISHIKVLAKR